MNPRRSFVAVVAALSLLATACGAGSSASTAVGPAAEPASESATEEVAETPPASTLVASTVSGSQIDFGSLQGQDVVLWFWAPW